MSCTIVGVIGQAGHGKDTVGDYFMDQFGFKRIALADRLKEEAMEMHPGQDEFHVSFDEQGRLSYLVTKDEMEAKNGPNYRRRFWQLWGTEGRREIDQRWWCKEWAVKAIQAVTQDFQGIIVPDLRFPNEVEFFMTECGGLLIYVDRGDFRLPGVDYTHASEKYVTSLRERAHYVVDNTRDLTHLFWQLEKIGSERNLY